MDLRRVLRVCLIERLVLLLPDHLFLPDLRRGLIVIAHAAQNIIFSVCPDHIADLPGSQRVSDLLIFF